MGSLGMRRIHHIMLHDFSRQGTGSRPHLATGVNRGLDPGVDIIANDDSKLAPSGINETAINHRPMSGPVVAQV